MDDFLKIARDFAQFGTNQVKSATEKLRAGDISQESAQKILGIAKDTFGVENFKSCIAITSGISKLSLELNDIPADTMTILPETDDAIADCILAVEELKKAINEQV